MIKKIMALGCVAALLLSGCQKGGTVSNSDFKFKKYPMETDQKLTYWMDMNTSISSVVDNAGKTDFAKELEKRTGVQVEYIHPATGQESTALNLMIASDQLPDLIETSWADFNGGAEKSISEGIIYQLNDIIDKNAPNLKKYLQEHPEIDKMVKTDEGNYYAFPFIRGDKRLLISVGTLIRSDWLKELGLEEPKTVADTENILRAFKEKKGATAPLSYVPGKRDTFLGNFGTSTGCYLEDGKVVYGPLTENYKTAVETLKRWYDEGLLDPNFVSVDDTVLSANVLNGKTGITVGTGGGNLGGWLDTMKDKDFDMTGIPFTRISEDKPISFYKVETEYPKYGSVAITTACKNPELAARWLDYAYSDEGHILYNFGVEGVSFEEKDGEYVYTDMIYNNPNGLTMQQAMANYFRSSLKGPFVQSKGYIDQFYFRPQQQQALDAWLLGYDEVSKNNIPNISRTDEEAKEYSGIMAEISKYESKMFTNFIIGTTPLSEYDSFVAKIKSLNIDRAIEIQEAALDRYNKR
ncbi:MAG: extracellular solute-binding protein [Clostridia bacterium]|nr:extracellular solute-binding protein [Clostridia bacterium]